MLRCHKQYTYIEVHSCANITTKGCVQKQYQPNADYVPFHLIYKMSTQLSSEMSLLLEKMKEQLNLQTITITENITTTVLKKVDEKIKPIIKENEKLKTEIEKLNRKIENLEMIGKRNNLLIHGLPEQKNETQENLKTLITTTMKDIDVIVKEEDINRILRLGKSNALEGKIRPILLATTTLEKKIQILKNKKKMKCHTYITHDLSKEAQLKKKEKKNLDYKENEKRKRSETPSPIPNNAVSKNNDPKVRKRDAFQYLRERSHSLSDRQKYRIEDEGITNRATTTQ